VTNGLRRIMTSRFMSRPWGSWRQATHAEERITSRMVDLSILGAAALGKLVKISFMLQASSSSSILTGRIKMLSSDFMVVLSLLLPT
jgi:hypothetical protein